MKAIKEIAVYNKDTEFGKIRSYRNYYYIPIPFAGYRLYFKNKKQAISEAAKISKMLNENLHELNFIAADVYSHYRLLWFYCKQSKINLYFNALNETFEKVTETEVIHYIFKHLNAICYYMVEILNILEDCCRNNNQYALLQKLKNSKKQVELIDNLIASTGSYSKYRVDMDSKTLF